MIGRDPLGIADVGLAHLEEAAAAGQQLQRGVDVIPSQGVEDDVDALALGELEELVPEVEIARGGDVVLGDAGLAQDVPLGGAGGGEDLGAEVLGELDRGHADAAGPGVDQHPLAGLQAGEVAEAVVGGEKDDRHRRRLGERPLLGDPDEVRSLGDRKRREGVGEQPHHAIAGDEIADLLADLDHDAGALAADRAAAGIEAEGDQHVAEVEPSGVDRDPHLAGAERRLGAGAGNQREGLQRAALGSVEAPGAGRRNQRIAAFPQGEGPRHQRDPLAQGKLWLVTAEGEGGGQSGDRGLGAIAVDQRELAGVLGLGRAHQAPDRCAGGVGEILLAGGDRALGEDRQAAVRRSLLVCQPRLQALEGCAGGGAGALGRVFPVLAPLAMPDLDLPVESRRGGRRLLPLDAKQPLLTLGAPQLLG